MKKLLLISVAVLICVGFIANAHASVDRIYEAAVIDIKGDVKVDTKGDGIWISPWIGMKLMTGAFVKTGPSSYVQMVYDAEGLNVVKVSANAHVIVNKSAMALSEGSVLANFGNLEPGSSFTVKTPTAACGIRGSGMGVAYINDMTVTTAFEDKVYVQGIDSNGNPVGQEVTIPEGWKAAVAKGGRVDPPAQLGTNEQKIWDAWISAVVVGGEQEMDDIDEDEEKEEEKENEEVDSKDLEEVKKGEDKPDISPSS